MKPYFSPLMRGGDKMRYIIMLLIILGLASADYLTGLIKAYSKEEICSSRMRKGGLNKLGELIVMFTACGLDLGMSALGSYTGAGKLSDIAGAIAAVTVFGYITVMETVSILENYAEINPEAKWTLKLIRKLKNINKEDE